MLSKLVREDPTHLMFRTELCHISPKNSDTFPSGIIFFQKQAACRFHFQILEKPSSLKFYLECIYLKRFGLRATRVSVQHPEMNFVGFMESVESDSSVRLFCLSIPFNRLDSGLRVLRLTCEVHVIGIESSFCLQLSDLLWKKQIIESMKGPFTDLILRVRGHTFPVHKSVLTARCPALKAKMKDIDVKQQLILDEDPISFRQFLHFLYTGLLDDSDHLIDMTTYAEKYHLETLPKFTEIETLEKITMRYFYYIMRCLTQQISLHIFRSEAGENSQLKKGGIVMQYSWTLNKLPVLNHTTFSRKSKDDTWFRVGVRRVRIIPYTDCSEFELYFFTARNSRVVSVSYFNKWTQYSQKNYNMDLTKNMVFKSNFLASPGCNCYQFTFYVTIKQPDNEEYRYELQDSNCPTQLWNSALEGETTDVRLRVCGRIFHAHRWILAARSPVFAAMFSNDMLETNTGCVDISDITPSTFEQLLFFIYNGRVFESAHNLLLLKAADKYQIETLVVVCRASLTLLKKDS